MPSMRAGCFLAWRASERNPKHCCLCRGCRISPRKQCDSDVSGFLLSMRAGCFLVEGPAFPRGNGVRIWCREMSLRHSDFLFSPNIGDDDEGALQCVVDVGSKWESSDVKEFQCDLDVSRVILVLYFINVMREVIQYFVFNERVAAECVELSRQL